MHRIDLVIPGEQYFYLRTSTQQERQHWLNALGSCKACLSEGKPALTREEEAINELRCKRSELRLYCDLIVQQVYTIKNNLSPESANRDLESVNDATSMLSATCDTFLATLQGCVDLAGARVSTQSNASAPPISPAAVPAAAAAVPRGARSARRSTSASVTDGVEPASEPPLRATFVANAGEEALWLPVAAPTAPAGAASNPPLRVRTPPSARKASTFFSSLSTSFEDLRLGCCPEAVHIDQAVPTLSFLDACRCVVDIFDDLSATAFAPVKMDITGNIRKIQQKYLCNPAAFTCIQSMLLDEALTKAHRDPNSACVATLWLTRSMQFIGALLEEVAAASSAPAPLSEDISGAVTTAYGRSLRPHHGWVVRGAVAMAMKALPYRSAFVSKLSTGPPSTRPDEVQPGVSRAQFEALLLQDMGNYAAAIAQVNEVLLNFLQKHGLVDEVQAF